MGLDQYVYRMSKVGRDTLKQLNGKNEEELADYFVITKKDMGEHSNMLQDLLPVLSPIKVKVNLFDGDRMRKEHGVPEDYFCNMEMHNDDTVTYGYVRRTPEGGWDHTSVTLNDDELKSYMYEEERDSYICRRKEVHYMRKEYDIDDAMAELYDGTLENCGYHHMNVDMIDTLNELSGKKILNPDATNLYYHQWY